ncbi:MAG: 2-amino-4-hydroxy-6-hydroxymethyldihydropteridine diphosphokinase [Prevotella sp.]|nr:2-amino-4-hydroxy-6-hydroxymethyldihydropteridine diphosphokinase [Prevotella sp.]
MTHDVIIALGSCYLPAVHIQWASERLAACLQPLRFSRKLWTEDIHATGLFYMNRLVAASTTLSAPALEQQLKAIEAETRRTRDCVTLDLDLMQYDGQRFHEKDWPRPYIRQLLPDIQ